MTDQDQQTLLEIARLKAANERFVTVMTSVVQIAKHASIWLGGGYFAFRAIAVLAGRNTTVLAQITAAINACEEVAAVFAPGWYLVAGALGTSVLLFFTNRRLRRVNADLTRRLGDVTVKYEQLSDPARSSSGLGPDGQARG